MKRLAIYVEGLTEQRFVTKLVEEVAGKNKVAIETRKTSGPTAKRSVTVVCSPDLSGDESYYVLICDCGGDATVKSDILDSRESLLAQGYEAIYGLRDVYPIKEEEIPRLISGLKLRVPTKDIDIIIFLAKMEIEAWFLAESSHFLKIHPALTPQVLKNTVGYEPGVTDPESRLRPAQDLHNIYRVENFAYKKTSNSIQRTVEALDYAVIYCDLRHEVSYLEPLIDKLDEFLS